MTATIPSISLVLAVTGDRAPEGVDAHHSSVAEIGGELLVAAGERDALVPTLWREGLLRARSPFVAFTTDAMRPRPGWLRSLRDALEGSDLDAVGGAIAPADGLGPLDLAIYLARYGNYLAPSPGAGPAGENAAYRRDRLLAVAESWRDGFWEAEVHAALAKTPPGLKTGLAADAVLEYSGGADWLPTLRRRFRHGRRHGATRGKSRWRALVGPVVPLRLGLRARAAARRLGPTPRIDLRVWSRWAAVTAAWTAGETIGLATRVG